MALVDKVEDLSTRIGNAIANLFPDKWYSRSDLPLGQKTSIKIYPTTVVINGKMYKNTTAKTIDLNSTSTWDSPYGYFRTGLTRGGQDVYIHACAPSSGTEPVFVLNGSTSAPTSYTKETSMCIGGFHCLCTDVGTISGHTLSGYSAGDILPLSVWDLKHYAYSGNAGMVFVNGEWVDIYLPSWDGSKLISKKGAVIADGNSGKNPANNYGFSGESFAEYAALAGKRLISRQTFMAAAEGTPEWSCLSTKVDPNTTGGHTDKEGLRIISNCGCEDCCGVMWQWTNELFESGCIWKDSLNSSATLANDDTYYTNKKQMNARLGWREESVWEDARSTLGSPAASYDTSGRGGTYSGLLRRAAVGGFYDGEGISGTRAIFASDVSATYGSQLSARLTSEAIEVV